MEAYLFEHKITQHVLITPSEAHELTKMVLQKSIPRTVLPEQCKQIPENNLDFSERHGYLN